MPVVSAVSTGHLPGARVTIETLVGRVKELVSLPDPAMRLGSLLSDPDTATVQIVELVGMDPALSARILRIANSALFGLHVPVDTIANAIAVLGIRKLQMLVFAASASRAINGFSGDTVNLDLFWQHSVGAALAAGSLAARGMRRNRDRIFLAALLHDVGQLVIAHQLPQISTHIDEARARGETQVYAENTLLGFTHADLGAALLELWKLPASLTEPVRYHHRCAEAPKHAAEAAVVHLASAIAHRGEHGDKPDTDDPGLPGVEPEVWELAGRHSGELTEIIEEVNANWFEVMTLIAPRSV